MVTIACALIPSVGLSAQQTTGAAASAKALDQLTAPIALYPDALVMQILTASKNPAGVQSFAVWLNKNASLKGSALQDAAQKAGFDPALVALAPFPQVVQMMVEKPEWTKALGQAVTADQKGVADSIQRLRAQAKAVGNLKTTKEQTVETQTTSSGTQVIVIQPANPQVIYVPVYNTQTVYVQQAPPPSSSSKVAGAALVGFTAGVIIGSAHQHSYYYHAYNDYWDAREDFYEDRRDYYEDRYENREDVYENRQQNVQANQDQRQTTRQANQGQRQSTRQSGAASYQSGASARAQSARGSASLSSSRGGGGGRGGGGRRK